MATSATYAFLPKVHEVIQNAYNQIGLEGKSSHSLTQGREALNQLLTEWSNENVNLWLMNEISVALTVDTTSYTLDNEVVDVLDAVVRDTTADPDIDLPCSRISLSEYLDRPVKAPTTGSRPVQFAVERNRQGHTLYVWPPAAESSRYQFRAWAMEYAQDAGNYDNDVDVPKRFVSALTWGLSAYLCRIKRKELMTEGMDFQAWMALTQDADMKYETIFQKAKDEDRERASFFVQPRIR